MSRIRQLARYATVSAIATTTSLVVLGALVSTRTLTPGWANLVATAAGTVPSFELNRRWVWGRTGTRSVRAEIAPFVVLSAAGLGLSTVTVVLTGRWADAAGLTATPRTLAVQAANLVGFGVVWLAQFAVCDRLLFRPTTPVPPRRPACCGTAVSRAGFGPLSTGAAPVVAGAAGSTRRTPATRCHR